MNFCFLILWKQMNLEPWTFTLKTKFIENIFFFSWFTDDTTQIRVGICLLPSWHVLLKITTNEDMAVVAIATDNWKILPLVNTFLHDIEGTGQRW